MPEVEGSPTAVTLLGGGGGYMCLLGGKPLDGGALPTVPLGPSSDFLSGLLRLADVVSSTGLGGTGGLFAFLDEIESIEVDDEDAV